MRPERYREYLEYIGAIGILVVIYFATAKFGLSLASLHASATPVWPPTGISLATLLIFGYRYWPGIFIGAFFANITTEGTLFTTFGVAAGNTLEAIVGSYLVNRYAGGLRTLESVDNTLVFIASAVLISPVFSASIGVGSLLLGGFIGNIPTATVWFTWWLGDAVSALILVPFLLLWTYDYQPRWTWPQLLELLAFGATFGLAIITIFFEIGVGDRGYPVFSMPLFVWAALRFSPREAMSAVFVASVVAVGATLQGLGPFADRPTLNESLLLLQIFVIVIGTTSLLLAITVKQRKQAERALLEADQRKDAFLASLSHELRNPLASIFSSTQLLQSVPGRHKKDVSVLRQIELDLRHTIALLEDLLDISRIRRGRMNISKEPFEITGLITEVGKSIAPLMREHGHTCTFDLTSETLWMVGDRNRVKQVLVNLLTNAAKYTDRGGTVHVTCRRTIDTAVIRVQDSGIGVAPEKLARIFDLDANEIVSEHRTRGGLGIGLSLAKRLVALHNGSLEASSEGKGKGSTFTVSLPLMAAEKIPRDHAKTVPIYALDKKPNAPLFILVVDDNKKAADALVQLLQARGHKAHSVYDGTSVFRFLEQQQVDAIVLDIALPDFSGYEIAEKIRGMRLQPEPILIALSGYGMEDDVSRSQEAGFTRHMVKPVDIAELESTLKQYS